MAKPKFTKWSDGCDNEVDRRTGRKGELFGGFTFFPSSSQPGASLFDAARLHLPGGRFLTTNTPSLLAKEHVQENRQLPNSKDVWFVHKSVVYYD